MLVFAARRFNKYRNLLHWPIYHLNLLYLNWMENSIGIKRVEYTPINY